MEITETGDIPPTIMVLREGKHILTATADQMDMRYALRAAGLCREGLNADAFLIILDSHVREEQYAKGVSEQEARQDFRQRFPPGSMQQMCDEQGACEAGILSDCLVIQYHGPDTHWWVSLLYKNHGKEFEWTKVKRYGVGEFEGNIYAAMQGILKRQRGMDIEGLKRIREALNLTEEDTYLRMGRAAVKSLCNLGYGVFLDQDCTEYTPIDCDSAEFGFPV